MTDLESLTAAMALVPMLYSRNRMFVLFANPVVRRAQRRARTVRALLRFVTRDDVVIEISPSGERTKLVYRIARLRLSRTVQLTDFELAVLRVLVSKSENATKLRRTEMQASLAASDHDRARVDAALARLPRDEAKSA